MNINNILPVFNEGKKPIIQGALASFSAPFSQIIAFSIAFSNFKKKSSPYKIYFIGLISGGLILLLISLSNILVLGVDISRIIDYPTYTAFSIINIAYILQRIEVSIATIFILGGFVKISILLLCTCKGITKLLGFNDYRFILIPISLLVINLSFFQYDSNMHYHDFQTKIWFYFTFPFQVILPIIILVASEIKRKIM